MTFIGTILAKLSFSSSVAEPFTIVYRVENSRGQGPYHAEDDEGKNRYEWGDVWESDEQGNDQPSRHREGNHPDPMSDDGFSADEKKLLTNKSIRFGFSSREQLGKWFNKFEIEKLAKLGFKVKEYKAAKVWDSGIQCMFLPYREHSKQS